VSHPSVLHCSHCANELLRNSPFSDEREIIIKLEHERDCQSNPLRLECAALKKELDQLKARERRRVNKRARERRVRAKQGTKKERRSA